MKIKYNQIPVLLALLFSVIFVSCKDEWNNHYYAVAANKSDSTMYNYIKSRSDLEVFAYMLQMTGYDTLLNKSQTFTVWAPKNESLLGVNILDTLAVRKIVENHITRFLHTTSGLKSKTILTMNNKLLAFAKQGDLKTFGGKTIEQADIATLNGIVHVLEDYAPYKKNIWEFINETDGLDSLRTYLLSLDSLVFDEKASYKDEVLVDSIMKRTNLVLDNLAALDNEDSTYTAILPDNAAWTEAYNRIYPFFKTLPIEGGVKTQRKYTQLNLVKDLFFRGKLNVPVSVDTLTSTNGNEFANPNRLFNNAQPAEMSNGTSYVTSQLNSTATESWFKERRIEAEWTVYDRTTGNYAASTVTALGTIYPISNKYYITLTPTTSSGISKLFVKFPLPNTLSAKYNVYCVFVPTAIADTSDKRPYKVKFYLSYKDANGAQVTDKGVTLTNTLAASTSQIGTFTTNPSTMTKMLVLKDFQFPFSNLMYTEDTPITVSLKVENAANPSGTDLVNFNRTVRIDCIILEPVQ